MILPIVQFLTFTTGFFDYGRTWRLFGVPAQAPFTVSGTPAQPGLGERRAITPEISALTEQLLKERHVPGFSVGVVRLERGSANTEYGSWGNMTEDGLPVTPDVRSHTMQRMQGC